MTMDALSILIVALLCLLTWGLMRICANPEERGPGGGR